jgi:hypothetical protein
MLALSALLLLLPALCAGTMGPLMPDVTLLDACGGELDPGGATPICKDQGLQASAAACAAACDAHPACSGATFHGPTTQQWANHCVFRVDNVYAPRPCGVGCDHTSANKTAGWVPAPPPPLPVWLPSLLPWGKPKAFWFGANSSGLDSQDTLALLARHAVAGYGWQTGHPGGGTVGTGEMLPVYSPSWRLLLQRPTPWCSRSRPRAATASPCPPGLRLPCERAPARADQQRLASHCGRQPGAAGAARYPLWREALAASLPLRRQA